MVPFRHCEVCNVLCATAGHFASHLRTTQHLNHLSQAIKLGLSFQSAQLLYGYTNNLAVRDETAENSSSFSGKDDDNTTMTASLVSPFASLSMVSGPQQKGIQNALRHGRPAPPAFQRRPLTMQQIRSCFINPLSFLNCLQLWPPATLSSSADAPTSPVSSLREDDGGSGRLLPLAVAGSFVSTAGVTDIIPPSHTVTAAASALQQTITNATATALSSSSSSLSAQHVWVLNLSAAPPPSKTVAEVATAPSSSSLRRRHEVSHRPQLLSPSLFVLAGYLAAASPQAMVALLFDAGHTHAHAMMLYPLGVWRLSPPLPVDVHLPILDHLLRGGGWPGLLVPLAAAPPRHGRDRESGGAAAVQSAPDDLHWCCPSCTCSERDGEEKAAAASVAATVLLVLQEYAQARRSMVMLTDYVERVACKLNMLSPPSSTLQNGRKKVEEKSPAPLGTAACGGCTAGVALLCQFLKEERGGQTIQMLLRDLGCVFASPPSAIADAEALTKSSFPPPPWSQLLSARALRMEAATLEMNFSLPAMLPSRLPSPSFAANLRSFYDLKHAARWNSDAKANSSSSPKSSFSTAAVAGQQMSINDLYSTPQF